MHAFRRFLARLVLPAPLLLNLLAAPAAAQLVEEVPFITSPDNVTLEMLRIAGVGPADHVIDLGSGDGRIVILAAKRFGASGLGVEIDPQLVQQSNRHARDAGVAGRVRFLEQDLFQTDLAPATVVTMYLLPQFNMQLRPSLLALKPGTRVVSHDWDMGDWKPDETTKLAVPDKKVGLEKSSKVHLWVVPARVGGLWCGSGPLGGTSLQLEQQHQEVDARWTRQGTPHALAGRVRGELLRVAAPGGDTLELHAAGDALHVVSAGGALASLRGTFRKAVGGSCA